MDLNSKFFFACMDLFESILTRLQQLIWGPPMLLLLFGTGAYLTIVLRGIQFRYLGYSLRELFRKESTNQKGDISPMASLMTSLSGAIGTGSIVGVATAVAIGGLGSIFWMWVSAIFALATKYSESLLAVKYREMDKRGEMVGGPMHYISKGLGWKGAALAFAFFGAFAALGTGNLVQVNAIAEAVDAVWQIPHWATGLGISTLTLLIILGGVRAIGQVAVVLVPVMALLYLVGGLIVLGKNASEVPQAFWLIVTSAFHGQAAAGGFIGSTVAVAMQMGAARSVFSNEAGLGVGSISAAAAKTDEPCRQAFLNMTGVIFSTVIVCTVTGLTVAVTKSYEKICPDGSALTGASMVIDSFQSSFPGGAYIVSIGLILFAFSTIIAWAYYGEKCCSALLGERVVPFYRLLFGLIIIPGAMIKMELIWKVADISNAFLAIPNLLALLALSQVVAKETERFTIPSTTQSTT